MHAFYYRHPEPLKTPVDVAWVADNDPGQLASSIVELPAGLNDVQSYLDLASRCDLSLEELDAALAGLVDTVGAADSPLVYGRDDEVACRFYANPRLISSKIDEIKTLSRAARQLYERRDRTPPLVILVENRDRSIRLSLDPDSLRRIRELLGPDWQIPPSVTVDHDVRGDFETLHGPILHHLIPVLTALDTPQIDAIGGVRFMTTTGRELPVPRSARKTIHVVGDRGFQAAGAGHGNAKSGNAYEVLLDDATRTTQMLGADLIEQEESGHQNVEWNGFPKKP